MIGFGLRPDGRDTICRTITIVASVTNTPRRSHTSCSHASLQGRHGSWFYGGAIFSKFLPCQHLLISLNGGAAHSNNSERNSEKVLTHFFYWLHGYFGKSQTVSELVALILDEAKVWAYAGHTHFFMLFPEFSQIPPSVAHLATGRDTFLL